MHYFYLSIDFSSCLQASAQVEVELLFNLSKYPLATADVPLVGNTMQDGQFERQINEFEGKLDVKTAPEFIKL